LEGILYSQDQGKQKKGGTMNHTKMKISLGISMLCMMSLFANYGYAVPITHSSGVYISNISISNLNSIGITNKVIDYNAGNTSARAFASDNFGDPNTSARTTQRGSVIDLSVSGNAFSLAALNYFPGQDSIFLGDNIALFSQVIVNDYGYASSLASFSEQIYFTALASTDITFSLDYLTKDDGFYDDGWNYSAAGVAFNIANFSDSIYRGGMAQGIGSGTLTTTLHFDQGERGWFAMNAVADNSYYRENPNPVPEPGTMILLGSGLVGLMAFRRRVKKA
jgi:hypothetical protein